MHPTIIVWSAWKFSILLTSCDQADLISGYQKRKIMKKIIENCLGNITPQPTKFLAYLLDYSFLSSFTACTISVC